MRNCIILKTKQMRVCNVKVKHVHNLTKHHNMQGCGDLAPRILKHCTEWKCVVSFKSQLLIPGERAFGAHLKRSPGGFHIPPGRFGKEKTSCSCRETNLEAPGQAASRQVAILTELPVYKLCCLLDAYLSADLLTLVQP